MKSMSEAIKEFKTNEAGDNSVNNYVKTATSTAWAKKQKDKWHNIFTNAGDKNGLSKERTPEDIASGKPRIISKDGIKNLYKLFINVAMDDVGANIGSQAWNSMTEKDILKMVNNVASAIGIRGYESLEKLPKSDGMRLLEDKKVNEAGDRWIKDSITTVGMMRRELDRLEKELKSGDEDTEKALLIADGIISHMKNISGFLGKAYK